MSNSNVSLASIPQAAPEAYKQLDQARHGNAPIYTLSLASLAQMPPLPVVDWASMGKKAPVISDPPGYDKTNPLPKSDVVIITWTNAEWAALDHVFCDSDVAMSYNAIANTKSWDGSWLFYARNFSSVAGSLTGKSPSKANQAWGRFRVVTINSKKVLLFKSDMHISTDGVTIPLINLVSQIVADAKPSLILSIGTAGGTRNQDDLGTVSVTHAAHFLLDGEFKSKAFNNKTYSSDWKTTAAKLAVVDSLLMQTPVATAHLQELLDKLNAKEKTNLTLNQVENKEIKPGAISPKLNIFTVPVLTTNGYEVGNTGGNYKDYAAVEMDDAVVGMQATAGNVEFGVLRNISDPVQNAALAEKIQQSWAGSIYNAYGFYSSYNGALAAWAVLQG
jgi:nucleoside phosphorylase